jgi:hypothetical protein
MYVSYIQFPTVIINEGGQGNLATLTLVTGVIPELVA